MTSAGANGPEPGGASGPSKSIGILCVVWATVVGVAPLAASGQEVSTNTPASGNPAVIADGKRLYLANGCYACHGIDAKGRIGPDLTRTRKTDDEMFDRIAHGKEGAAMGPFQDKIRPDEIRKIIAYLRSLAEP